MNEEQHDHTEWYPDPGLDSLDMFVVMATIGAVVIVGLGLIAGVAYLIDTGVQWALA